MLVASLLQLTPEETLENRRAIQAIRAHEKEQELVEKEKNLMEMETRIQEQQLILIKKAKKSEKIYNGGQAGSCPAPINGWSARPLG